MQLKVGWFRLDNVTLHVISTNKIVFCFHPKASGLKKDMYVMCADLHLEVGLQYNFSSVFAFLFNSVEQTADSDTVSSYQVSSVQLVTDK